MRIFICTVSALALMAAGNIALAHGSGGGTSTYEAKSPGIQFNIAPTHHKQVINQIQPSMEVSVDGQTITLKITDTDGKPIDGENAYAKTFVTAGGKISTLNLWPTSGNVLSGTGDFSPDPDLRIEVILNLPDAEPVRQDFYPLR